MLEADLTTSDWSEVNESLRLLAGSLEEWLQRCLESMIESERGFEYWLPYNMWTHAWIDE